MQVVFILNELLVYVVRLHAVGAMSVERKERQCESIALSSTPLKIIKVSLRTFSIGA